MSRSDYSEDIDPQELALWREAVRSAINGTLGQAMLRELAAALDAMPEKALVAMALFDGDGNVCSLGAPGQASGTKDSMRQLDPEAYGSVAGAFGVAPAMIREIAYENDESVWESETPEHRWRRIRAWVTDNLKGPT